MANNSTLQIIISQKKKKLKGKNIQPEGTNEGDLYGVYTKELTYSKFMHNLRTLCA